MLKFKEEKITGILGITTTYTVVEEDGSILPEAFSIWADKQGVRFKNNSPHLATRDDFEILARTIGQASKLYLCYRPKVTNAAGH